MLTCTLILLLTGAVAASVATYHTPRAKRRLADRLIDFANWLVSCSARLYASAAADDCWRQCYERHSECLIAHYARQGKEQA